MKNVFEEAFQKALSGWIKVELSVYFRSKSDSSSERKVYAFLLNRGKVEKRIFLSGENDEWWEGDIATYADCGEYAKSQMTQGEEVNVKFLGELIHSTFNGELDYQKFNFRGYEVPNSIIVEILK